MKKIRILLADDHALFRYGIRALLDKQDDIEVVGEAVDGQEAITKVQKLRPDVVLMDIAMPGATGLEATRQIKTTSPDIYILILTMLEDEHYFFQSIQAGALGFILKGAMPEELLAAVRTVADGQAYLHGSLSKKLMKEYLNQAQTDEQATGAKALTDREQQVVRLISDGRTGKEIASALEISVHTVERHRQNVMAKLGLRTRAELIKYAIRKGLIEADS